MARKTICISFLILMSVVLSCPAFAQQLTEHDVRTMLDKLGQASATDDFTLTQAQADQLNALSKDLRDSLQIQTDSPCVLNPRDPRVLHHQFIACKGLFPPGMSPQETAHYFKFGHPFPWHVVVIDIPTDPGDDPNEKLVQYTWEYDFSGLPAPVQQILKGSGPRPGMSLFRLDNGTWQWVAYR
jgi:hypothetical protein